MYQSAKSLTWGTEDNRDRFKQALQAFIGVLHSIEEVGENVRHEEVPYTKG